MHTRTERRHRLDEAGFSLVELMVVMAVIGILLAISVPTFLGARSRAGDRAVQSDLRTGIVNAKVIADAGSGRFLPDGADTVTPAQFVTALEATEGSVSWNTTSDPATAIDEVTVDVDASGGAVLLYKRSRSGAWFGIASLASGDILYCRGAGVDDVDGLPGSTDGCTDRSW